jgi:AP-3 complex subunit mu
VDPLLAFAFIRTFTEILQEYFGTITPATLRENFDVVYQLLEETLDSSGHPLTTSPGTLKDIVIPPSLFNKILSSIGPSGMGSATGSSAFNSPIPWRKAGIKHNHNEIYFDIVERLEGTVNK